MKLKIYGGKWIDQNNYSRLIIRNNEEQFRIDVTKSDKEIPMIKSLETNFIGTLRGKTDYEKVREIIKHFLENSTVDKLEDGVPQERYIGRFCTVSGNRSLWLQLQNIPEYKGISEIIMRKYLVDRWAFLVKNQEVNNYVLSANALGRSYYAKKTKSSQTLIEINLNVDKDGSINPFEQEFLLRFISDKLSVLDRTSIISFEELSPDFIKPAINSSNIVNINGCQITIHNKLIKFINPILEEYNENIEKSKTMQLKMEGF